MINWNAIGAMILPNIGGWAGAITMTGEVRSANGTAWYESINKPSWNPPNWVFGPAWTALYTGMGYASYMVYEDCGGFTDDALIPLALYGGHLLINWTWTPVFFKFHQIGLALIHMFVLDAAATACTLSFFRINKKTLFFMAPYLCWLTFATCLNYSIWQLNKDDSRNK
ncbi:translocator protein-like [Vanessa atalanta]|uniref:translocator protein-like n=1 Tax=Vanessa atalanta TaxID=42275 RepID=UPI001FCCE129|nr:translocator protein-like [Vanessa atalanta]